MAWASLWLVMVMLWTVQGLKFDLVAQPQGQVKQKCIRNFVNANTLVVVTATISGQKGDGQVVNIDVGGVSSCMQS